MQRFPAPARKGNRAAIFSPSSPISRGVRSPKRKGELSNGLKRATVDRARTQGPEGFEVRFRAISFVLFESVTGILLRRFAHHPITGDFGKNSRWQWKDSWNLLHDSLVGIWKPLTGRPSMRHIPGSSPSATTARSIPRWVAFRILSSSISAGSTKTTAHWIELSAASPSK